MENVTSWDVLRMQPPENETVKEYLEKKMKGMMGVELVSKRSIERDLANGDFIVFVNHLGESTSSEEVFEQLDEGWNVGVVNMPISNAGGIQYVVATSTHKDHQSLDAGDCVELAAVCDGVEFDEFMQRMRDSGGLVLNLERDK